MGKSLGNTIDLFDVYTGNHKLMEQAYSPMTIRFFIMQAHYRSTLDFSNEALQAAEKGLARLLKAGDSLTKLKAGSVSDFNVNALKQKCYEAMNDDFNSPILIANLFDGLKMINSLIAGNEQINANDLEKLKALFQTFTFDILGLKPLEKVQNESSSEPFKKAVDMLLELRSKAKANKDWGTADYIRDKLSEIGFEVKDTKEGFEWKLKS